MENKPLISVIVPVYNVQKYVRKSVESILQQTYKNLEIILVDDGSTDESGKICDMLARSDNRVTVIHKKNGGLSDARNAGLDRATGELIGFVDSDDYIEKNMYGASCWYKNPSSLCVNMFFTPPTSELTTGVPKIIASPTEFGEFSIDEGEANTFANKYCSFISSAFKLPKNTILFSRLYCLISFSK